MPEISPSAVGTANVGGAAQAQSGSAPTVTSRPRLDSIDLLRGLVMVIMALDHTRDFFTNVKFDPTDLTQTNTALFFTRWITHFCAPVFVFLAGTGIFLSASRGKTKREMSWFLLTRGLWLVLLELTIVRFNLTFDLNYRFSIAQVIWVIGWSMVIMAALIHLPTRVVLLLGVIIVAGHNLLDHVNPASFGRLSWLWIILNGGLITPKSSGAVLLTWRPDHVLLVAYPLLPWFGVMACGYGFGQIFQLPRERRNQVLLRLGLGLTLAFIVIRAINLYGDPVPWTSQKNLWFTVLSFINCEKYPPSLLFDLMTLGPAITLLALFDRDWGSVGRFFTVYGRVPLFYYIPHFLLIHLLAGFVYLAMNGWKIPNLTGPLAAPANWGFGLPVVYLVWAGVVLSLCPLCRWYAGVKQRSRSPWLSYL